MKRITMEELTIKIQTADRVEWLERGVRNNTRVGNYVTLQTGLVHRTYFFGFGRDGVDFLWEQWAEQTA